MEATQSCKCMTPPLHYQDVEQDAAGDLFQEDRWGGEITVERCKSCGTKWIRYFIEYPAFTSSGRWCRAPVTDEVLRNLSADEVLAYIVNQPLYLYGGSFFGSSGKVGTRPVNPEFWVRTR